MYLKKLFRNTESVIFLLTYGRRYKLIPMFLLFFPNSISGKFFFNHISFPF